MSLMLLLWSLFVVDVVDVVIALVVVGCAF